MNKTIVALVAAILGVAAAVYICTNLAWIETARFRAVDFIIPAGEKEEVVFDQSYMQMSSPFDTGIQGMSMLAAELRHRKISVSINSLPLDELLPMFMGAGHILVLGVPSVPPAQYRDNDIEAIRSFVSAGGALLVITEHDNAYANHRFQGKLLDHYGITMNLESAFGAGKTPDLENWPLSTSLLWQFKNIKYFYATSISTTDPAETFTVVNKPKSEKFRINGAINRKNPGTVVTLGDYEILWNMTPGSGVRYGDNLAFIMKTVELLKGTQQPQGTKSHTAPAIDVLQMAGAKGTVLFSRLGNGLVPDCSVSGLYRFARKLHEAGYGISVKDQPQNSEKADCLVLACPVTSFNADEALGLARKFILVADGLTSMEASEEMNASIKVAMEQYHLKPDFTEYDHPLNKIAVSMGFRFAPVTVLSDNASNQFEARSYWTDNDREFLLRRGCIIEPASSAFPGELRVMARTEHDCWPEKNLINTFIAPGKAIPYEPKRIKRGEFPVVVSSRRVFAISDVELLTNQFINTPEGKELFTRIIEWLGESP
ncbi:MAG: hypothetical protein JW807_14305 [Spirochaetes bacterium]|nr:hypothetical protein [Spirochaetota bacterium]